MKKAKTQPTSSWRPTVEDQKLMDELRRKLGVNESSIIRMGLRSLAAKEGLAS